MKNKVLLMLLLMFSLTSVAGDLEWHPQKCKNGKYGYWNSETSEYAQDYDKTSRSKWLFPPVFEEASEFNADSIAVVKQDGKYRFINLKGKNLFPHKYDYAENFFKGIAVVRTDGDYYAINLRGEKISPDFKEMHHKGSLIWAKEPGQSAYSLYDAEFKPIGSATFDEIIAIRYNPHKHIVYKRNGLIGFCDAEGKDLTDRKFEDFEDKYLLLYAGWKKLYKDRIHDWHYEWFKQVKDPSTHLWGVIDLRGNEIVPFKYKDSYDLIRKGSKKKYKEFKELIFSKEFRDSNYALLSPAQERTEKAYEDIAKARYPQEVSFMENIVLTYRTVTPDSVTGDDVRMVLMRGDAPFGKPYRDITQIGNVLVLTDTLGKMGIIPANTTAYPEDCRYSEVSLWNDSDRPHLIVGKGGKYGLISSWYYDCTQVLPFEFDMILPKSTTEASLAIKDGLYYIVNEDGNVSKRGYDDAVVSGYSYEVTRYGLTTKYLVSYKKEVPALHDKAVSMAKSLTDHEEATRAWETAAELADNNEDKGNDYNNAGVVCINAGDRDGAYYYYEKGAALGNKYSISNLNALQNQDSGGGTNGWVMLAEALSGLANDINGTVQQYYASKNGGGSRSGNHSGRTSGTSRRSSSTSSSSGNSKAYYQARYDRWEKVARSTYESATNLGIKVKDKDGKDIGGKYGGKGMYWSTYKTNLTKAQREMRAIRLEAKRNGHVITQSSYETVNLVL